jgi:hypothetical protein
MFGPNAFIPVNRPIRLQDGVHFSQCYGVHAIEGAKKLLPIYNFTEVYRCFL